MANPNPSPETRFKPGQSGNPGGKSSEHRKAEVRAAELAAKIQLDIVQALADAVDECSESKEKLDYLNKEVNALLKNVQDRGFGTPKQTIESDSNVNVTNTGLGDFYADISTEIDGKGVI